MSQNEDGEAMKGMEKRTLGGEKSGRKGSNAQDQKKKKKHVVF